MSEPQGELEAFKRQIFLAAQDRRWQLFEATLDTFDAWHRSELDRVRTEVIAMVVEELGSDDPLVARLTNPKGDKTDE